MHEFVCGLGAIVPEERRTERDEFAFLDHQILQQERNAGEGTIAHGPTCRLPGSLEVPTDDGVEGSVECFDAGDGSLDDFGSCQLAVGDHARQPRGVERFVLG